MGRDSASIRRDVRRGHGGTNAEVHAHSSIAVGEGEAGKGRRQVSFNKREQQQGGRGSGPPDVPGWRRAIKIKC